METNAYPPSSIQKHLEPNHIIENKQKLTKQTTESTFPTDLFEKNTPTLTPTNKTIHASLEVPNENPVIKDIRENTLNPKEENHDHSENIQKEIKIIENLYKEHVKNGALAQHTNALIVTNPENNKSYLIVPEEHNNLNIKSVVKINLQNLQSLDALSEINKGVLGRGGCKTALKGKDIFQENKIMALAVFHRGKESSQGAINVSKEFTNEKYFAFGTWIKFEVTDKDGKNMLREAYLGPAKMLGTLNNYLEPGLGKPKPTEIEIIQMLLPAVKGIQKMHGKGFAHRDLKPENLFVDKIVDKKGVTVVSSTVADPDTGIEYKKAVSFKGSLPWMAPELFNIKPNYETGRVQVSLDEQSVTKTDVYSLGTIFFKATTGKEFNEHLEELTEKKVKAEKKNDESFYESDLDWGTELAGDSLDRDAEKRVKKKTINIANEQTAENSSEIFEEKIKGLTFNKKAEGFKKLSPYKQIEFLNKISGNEQQQYLQNLGENERNQIQELRIKDTDRQYEYYKKLIKEKYYGVTEGHQYLMDNYNSLEPLEPQAKPLEHLAWRCVNPDPNLRPSLDTIVKDLKLMLSNLLKSDTKRVYLLKSDDTQRV